MTNPAELPELSTRKVGGHLRRPDFDNLVVPEDVPPVRYAADDAAIKAYCYAVDCYDPWYSTAVEPFGFRLAPSGMILKELMWFYQTQYERSLLRGFHQHELVKFHRPIPAGTKLILTGRNTRKYVRRGKGYFIHESQAEDAEGRVYVSQINTELIDMSVGSGYAEEQSPPKGRRITGDWDPRAPTVAQPSQGVKVGDRLPEVQLSVNRAQVVVFSGAADDFRNLHTDTGIAGELGFSNVVVQGLMNVCWLSEQLTRWAGPAWLQSGELNASFLKPMLAGAQVTIKSRVSSKTAGPGTPRIEIETAFVNSRGENQAVSIASMDDAAARRA